MVSEKKKVVVQNLVEVIKKYPIIAVVNMQNLPTKQLQNMRKQLLKKDILITMARKKLLQLALKNSQKQNIEQLIQKMKGMPALLLAKENPFTLYSILQKNKSPAPAKANQTAPKDIVVPAGPTNFAPGPIISELANVGIKTKVEDGKLAIIQDATVVKEDEVISQKLAELLKRLDIQPMEIGLDLVAVWENETVFDAKQLHIDEEEYSNNITLASQEAFNLALEIAYCTSDNIELLLQKAFRESKTLASEQNILTDENTEEILAKTEQEALALKNAANIETIERKEKEEPVEESKAEEQPKEESEEKESAPAEEEPKEEEKLAEITEEKEETQVEEQPKEESTEEKAPVKEETTEEETAPEEKVVEEEKKEEVKEEEPEAEKVPEEKAPVKEEKEAKEEESKDEDIPSAEDLIKATKERFAQGKPEEKAEVVEEKISAEDLVAEEKKEAEKEKPKKDEEVEEAESLLEKLKKEGTLREQ